MGSLRPHPAREMLPRVLDGLVDRQQVRDQGFVRRAVAEIGRDRADQVPAVAPRHPREAREPVAPGGERGHHVPAKCRAHPLERRAQRGIGSGGRTVAFAFPGFSEGVADSPMDGPQAIHWRTRDFTINRRVAGAGRARDPGRHRHGRAPREGGGSAAPAAGGVLRVPAGQVQAGRSRAPGAVWTDSVLGSPAAATSRSARRR